MDKIDVVMLACDFNEHLSQLTQNGLESIKATEGDLLGNLIVVDNASTLGGGFMRSKADIYVRNAENKGYTGAVNQGYALSKNNMIAICNNDIRVSPNWAQVASEILKDPEVGSVHFKMVGYDEPFNLGNDVWKTGKERWCHASFYVIKRDALPEGLYYEGYKEGGMDDWDFFHRVRHLNGWKTAYTNKAAFQHMDSSTYMALDDRDGGRSERDIKNAEMFKERFREYAEKIWQEKYPDQFKEPWRPFP